MEIKLLKLRLKNFKGIKELEINFDGRSTNIYGKNATGKTTIFDAFKWLFFNKDSNNKTKFSIKTLDKNCEPLHFLEHEVEAILSVDGQEIKFKRVMEENWVKKRGKEQQEYNGSDSSNYWIDDIPVKQKDYEEKVNKMLAESTFKLITDPLFFNTQMEWQERRKLLIKISEKEVTDEELFDSNEQFLELRKKLNGKTIEDYKKMLSEQVNNLKDEVEKIPVQIDTLTETLITEHNIDHEKLEQEKADYNDELQKIEKEMSDIQIRAQGNMKKVDELTTAKNELHNLKFRLEVENSNKYSSEKIALDNEKSLLETKLRNNKQQISELEIQIKNDENRRQVLYEEWDKANNAVFGMDFTSETFTCPTCKREYSTEKKEEMKKVFLENFNKDKENEKKRINEEGQAINKRLQENSNLLKTTQEEIDKLTEGLSGINSKIAEYEKQKSEEKGFDINKNIEYSKKAKQVEELQQIVNSLTSEDITEIQNNRNAIINQINNIDKQLNEKETQEKIKLKIKQYECEEQEKSKKIQDLELQLFKIEEFIRLRARTVEETVNNKFEIVKFRMFEPQKNGGLKETCEATVNGVPFSDVNNAHKILAGLDIIKTLSRFYNTSAPIFIDNRESINSLHTISAQIISLIVTTDSQLRIEVI